MKDYFLPSQNCINKPVYNNVNRPNHSSPMNNTVTSNIKNFPQLLTLDPQIFLKQKWQNFLHNNCKNQTTYICL